MQPITHNSLFTIHHSEFSSYQPLSFQQHSRFQRVTTFVFYNIPASLGGPQVRSFVFNNVPASFPRFLKLLVFSFPIGGDILSRAAMPTKIPPYPASLKCSRQSTVSRRQSAVAKRKKAIHHSPFTIALITCPCSSTS